MGRPLTPPEWLMRSTAICVPTSAVLPPAAPVPESGWSTPTLYGLAWPNASRHGAGTSIVAPRAPAVADVSARNLRRVVLPLHHMSFAQGSSCHRSAIGFLLAVPRHANACATAHVMSGKRNAHTYTNPPPRARVHLPSPQPKPTPGSPLVDVQLRKPGDGTGVAVGVDETRCHQAFGGRRAPRCSPAAAGRASACRVVERPRRRPLSHRPPPSERASS